MAGIPNWLLRFVVPIVNRWRWASRKVNAIAINGLVTACRERPHPWSTAHDYISWTSLTDRRWSARHLPAVAVDPSLPPAADVGALFRRPPGVPQRSCDKSTVLFPAFAQYLTDGFIRTRMPHDGEDQSVRLQNTSNHQIDLCPLYGRTPAQTSALRRNDQTSGERGRLLSQMIDGEEFPPFLHDDDGKVDARFAVLDPPLGLDEEHPAEKRRSIFAMGGDRVNAVPQVAMMNVLLLREHNAVAAAIEAAHPDWDDERVFETARNVVIVEFITIVVEDYINHISSSPFRFVADPSVASKAVWNRPNWMTTEFSLLYRWHSLVPDQVTWAGRSRPVQDTFLDNRPLLDGGLLRAFADMSAQPAGALGAHNTAAALVHLEEAAIAQGRLARLAPYGDYREYMGLSRPERFEDISSDPTVVSFLAEHYESPDRVDFYVGLFAEDPVANSPLPPLLLGMVAVDAFSQALTNPLLSPAVMSDPVAAFSAVGWERIQRVRTVRDLVDENCPGGAQGERIAMTQKSWRHRW